MAKRISFALVFALSLSLFSFTPSRADEEPRAKLQKVSKNERSERVTKGPRCEQTSAIGHAPVEVPIPERVMTARQLQRVIKQIVLETNCGEIVIQPMYQARVALTALHALIRGGFYDQSLCHRLTTDRVYILQCGDPTATGRGGPNFTYGLENLPPALEGNYPEGVVGIANTGTPDSNGSQFFIAYEDSTFPPNYTIVGRVIKGLDIVKFVARSGTKDGSGNGMPKQTIAIEKASIR